MSSGSSCVNEEADIQRQHGRLLELRELCGLLNLTQRGMSRVLELHPDAIRHMCSGHQPVPLTVLYAARYLRLTSPGNALR